MTNSTHTPGPWKVEYNGTYGPFIASCDPHHPEYGAAAHHLGKETHDIAQAYGNNARANARFIVTACNAHADLLEALEAIRGAVDGEILVAAPALQAIGDTARTAIRKARGEGES